MSEVGTTYAAALYELAKDEGLSASVLEDLNALSAGFTQEPQFLRLLSSAALPKQERIDLIDRCFRGKLQPYTLNFLKLLTERSRIQHFPDCVRAFQNAYNQDHGILPVQASTAIPLTEEQAKRLSDKLAAITGKTIALTNLVDLSCLGGVRLHYDGVLVDDTVAHRLATVRDLLKNTVL